MTEKIFNLENVDLLEFYGVNNYKFNKIEKSFSKLKIVARGNEIKITGEESEINLFEEKIKLLIDYFYAYNKITDEILDNILQSVELQSEEAVSRSENILLYGNNGKLIKTVSENQKLMVEKSLINDLMFVVGPAGTGKTYIAIALAVKALRNKEIKRIILSRPAVEAGENLGYLPGDLKEKLDPYLQPIYDALMDIIPSRKLKEYFEEGTIEIAPLAFMRGRTLDNAYVILDEAQNSTINQLKMFLTRMGRNAKFIITGDITQIDLPQKQQSGLVMAINILKNIEGIGVIEFNSKDIIRHKLVKQIVDAYHENQS
jgi:phosphate starvation-inducible protein PhoH and related proteins